MGVVAAEMVPSIPWTRPLGCVAGVFEGAPSWAGVMGDALQPLFTTDLLCLRLRGAWWQNALPALPSLLLPITEGMEKFIQLE